MTSVYAYGTAHAVVMVGSFGAEGLKPRQIGPAHATIGRVNGQSRKALCGAYVSIDEQLPWPPEGYEDQQLCANCADARRPLTRGSAAGDRRQHLHHGAVAHRRRQPALPKRTSSPST